MYKPQWDVFAALQLPTGAQFSIILLQVFY